MKARPPRGVTAPKKRTPVRLKVYRLPQKSTRPAAKNQPAAVLQGPGQRLQAQAVASKARAWYMW